MEAIRNSERLLIEVKTWDISKEEHARLDLGDPVRIGGPIRWHPKDHGKLSKAAQQIASVASDGRPCHQLIWARVVGPGSTYQTLRMFSTLYGVRFFHIVEGPLIAGVNVIPCYFAEPPLFARMPEVSAVVVQSLGQIGLRVNPLCKATELLTQTRLFSLLNEARVVFHLPEWRQVLPLYVADEGSLTDEDVTASLWRDYGVKVRPMRSQEVQAVSTSWPGNEMGHTPSVPGGDLFVPLWDLLDRAHRASLSEDSGPSGSGNTEPA